jgi:uncharacterized protein YjdB
VIQSRLLIVAVCTLGIGCGGGATAVSSSPKVVVSSAGGSRTPLLLTVGESSQFSVLTTDANGTPLSPSPSITWQSTSPAAAVDSKGLVTGVSVGIAYIKATANSNGERVTDSVKVTVVIPT